MAVAPDDDFEKAVELDARGRHGEAVRIYASLAGHSTDARVFMAYGRCLQSLGHWAQSIAQLQRAIALKPAYCEGDTRLALATALMRVGNKTQAIEQWELVASMPAEYPSYGAVPSAAKAALAEHAKGKIS